MITILLWIYGVSLTICVLAFILDWIETRGDRDVTTGSDSLLIFIAVCPVLNTIWAGSLVRSIYLSIRDRQNKG